MSVNHSSIHNYQNNPNVKKLVNGQIVLHLFNGRLLRDKKECTTVHAKCMNLI